MRKRSCLFQVAPRAQVDLSSMTAGFKKSQNIPTNQGIACWQVKKKNLSIIMLLIKKSQRVPGGADNTRAQISYSFWWKELKIVSSLLSLCLWVCLFSSGSLAWSVLCQLDLTCEGRSLLFISASCTSFLLGNAFASSLLMVDQRDKCWG